MSDFHLNITGASGSKIPYIGYIKVEVNIPHFECDSTIVPILIVPLTEYSGQVPVIIGTNIISTIKAHICDIDGVPSAWSNAFTALSCCETKPVKSTTNTHIILKPNECRTITGMVRCTSQYSTAVTENMSQHCDLNVCPRVVSVKQNCKTTRIPVRVCNISIRPITIKPKTQLCDLHEVQVIKSVDPFGSSVPSKDSSESFDKYGIGLPEDNLSSGELSKARELLCKWTHIFSTGPTDLGFTDLVEHEIKLTNEEPFKDPYRRKPPALFEEVREHLKEM